jgi:hypothetical protein
MHPLRDPLFRDLRQTLRGGSASCYILSLMRVKEPVLTTFVIQAEWVEDSYEHS